jgi:hypothetical protein
LHNEKPPKPRQGNIADLADRNSDETGDSDESRNCVRCGKYSTERNNVQVLQQHLPPHVPARGHRMSDTDDGVACNYTWCLAPGSVHRGVCGQGNDWELTAGPRLELGEVRCECGDLRPQLVSLGIASEARVNVVLPLANPDVALTRRFEVQKPLRGSLGAAHPRSYNDVVAVVVKVGDRDGVRYSALATGHGQQQQREPPIPWPPTRPFVRRYSQTLALVPA